MDRKDDTTQGRRRGRRSVLCGWNRGGFTLIELLTAMAVLSVLVVAVANLFTHSATAWDSGTRRTKSMMVGRALTDYFMRDGANVLFEKDGTPVSVLGYPYCVLKGTADWVRFEPAITPDLFEDDNSGGQRLLARLNGGSFTYAHAGIPRLLEVEIEVTTVDKGRTEDRLHTGRVFLWNRNRYRFD